MTNSENKKLLIAEPSNLVSKILKIALAQEQFEISVFSNEIEAFDNIPKILPDCILLNRQLSELTGAQLCSLIKASDYSNIPVIIYSIGNERISFLLENSGAEKIVNISLENTEELISAVKTTLFDSLEFDFYEDSVQNNKGEIKSPEICAVNAMEKNRYYYNTLRMLFEMAPSINNLDDITRNILLLLYKICDYDMAVFVYNQHPYNVYLTKVTGFDKSDKHDFLKICRTDFESNLTVSTDFSYIKKSIDVFPEEKDLTDVKFASYRCFSLKGDKFIGTIHLASRKKNFFNNEICDKILYFADKVYVMVNQALKFQELTTNEKRMRSAFSKYVPGEIINDLLSSEIEKTTTVNEKRKVAILICDIRNFTTISEVNEPENVVSFLNGYFTQMVEVIKKHGGTIDKFIGDAIMALFGAPVSYADNAERALKAALEMTELIPNIPCDLIKIPEGLTFDVGTGIHYGEVIVGSIGCEDKSDYTVIGDSANLTSRLEGLTKIYGAKIIVSQSVIDELKGSYNLLNVDTVKVKGKHTGVPIYRADLEPLPDDYVNNYSKGLVLYKNGAWNLALGYFENALAYLKNDKSSILMIDRCKEFIKNPPENWQGAISLTSK